jgi:lysophospholipase L1-like esterase
VELAQEYPEKLAVVYDGRLMNDPMYHYSSDYIHINAAGMDKLGKESALGIANALGCK